MSKSNTAHYAAILLLSVFCITLSCIPYPPILGMEEGSIFFHLFAPKQIYFDLRIHPRANIGGYGYAALDAARFVVEKIGLSVTALRALPVLYGLVSLVLFYTIANRWYGKVSAFFSTAILATNPVFLVFQHELIISIVTFCCLLFCIERLQKLELTKTPTTLSAIGFGVASALCALHYQVGRYTMIAIWLYWLSHSPKKKLRLALISFLALIFTLEVFDLRNIYYLFNKHFLSPQWGEHARNSSDAIAYFKVNIPIILKGFLGLSEFFSPFRTDLIVDKPHRFLLVPGLIFFVIGLVKLSSSSFRGKARRNSLFQLYLLVVTVAPLALSEVNNGITTLSNYRLFLALIPIHFAIGAAIDAISERVKNKSINRTIFLCVCSLLVVYQTATHVREIARFEKFITAYDFKSPLRYKEWGYYQEQLPYYKKARQILNALKAKPELETSQDKILLFSPASEFKPDPVFHHYRGYNFHQVFLALYLADAGIDAAVIQFFETNAVPSATSFSKQMLAIKNKYPRFFRGDLRQFPAFLAKDQRSYAPQTALEPHLRESFASDSRFILATTDEERLAAIKLLNEQKTKYKIYNF